MFLLLFLVFAVLLMLTPDWSDWSSWWMISGVFPPNSDDLPLQGDTVPKSSGLMIRGDPLTRMVF